MEKVKYGWPGILSQYHLQVEVQHSVDSQTVFNTYTPSCICCRHNSFVKFIKYLLSLALYKWHIRTASVDVCCSSCLRGRTVRLIVRWAISSNCWNPPLLPKSAASPLLITCSQGRLGCTLCHGPWKCCQNTIASFPGLLAWRHVMWLAIPGLPLHFACRMKLEGLGTRLSQGCVLPVWWIWGISLEHSAEMLCKEFFYCSYIRTSLSAL